jgi:3-hydroxyisobutyrate dehydrogenase
MSWSANNSDSHKRPRGPSKVNSLGIGVTSSRDSGDREGSFTFARGALPYLRAKQVYADVNTATPESMRKVSAIVATAQVVFVDVAIMGAIELHRHRAPMLAAGDGAMELETGLTPFGFRIRSIAGTAGDASAIKLLRSVFTKGLEALCVEAFTTARRFGTADQIIENLSDLEEAGFAKTIRMLITTHCRHARRRLDEVRSLFGLFAEASISPVMTRATEDVFRRSVDSTVPEWAAGVDSPSFGECLDHLLAIARTAEPAQPG